MSPFPNRIDFATLLMHHHASDLDHKPGTDHSKAGTLPHEKSVL